MSDMLRDGQSWLAAKLTSHAAHEVVYRRDSLQATVLATIGKTDAEQESADGLVTRTEVRDYLINTASLVLGGVQTLPQRGDEILETDEGQVFVYEVLPRGSDRAWRYSDPFRLKLRIHTKLIATEAM